jgi:hypothetical protein
MSLPSTAHALIASHAHSKIARPHISIELIDNTTNECVPLLKSEFGHIRDYELEIFSSAKKAVNELISSGVVTVVVLESPAGTGDRESARTSRLLMPKGWQVN